MRSIDFVAWPQSPANSGAGSGKACPRSRGIGAGVPRPPATTSPLGGTEERKPMRKLHAAVALVACLAGSALVAAPASAQNQQQGLVNVAVEDVIVQVPVAVAANICDVNVAVLAEVADDAAACEATADSTATAGPNGGNQPTRQEGLVNVLLDDVLIQVPVAVAANICDVNVAVLAQLADDAEACNATADAAAQPGSGPGGGNGNGGANGVFIPIDISLGGFTPLDNNTADDGGQGDIVGTGSIIDPNNLGGLMLLA